MNHSAPIASLVVPLDGGAEQALRCLQALAALPEDPPHEVLVVDDASTGLEQLLGRLDGDVEVLISGRRLGFGGAANLGAARARGEIVVALRGAAEVEPGWLAPLVAALSDPEVALVTSVGADGGPSHPVGAHAVALRAADLSAAGGFPQAPAGLDVAALCTALAPRGRIEAVPASRLRPPGSRMIAARHEPGRARELTIVIPTLDATSDRVRACVAAVQRTTQAPHDIVLVDNGSPPQGFTDPVNAGIRAASGAYVVVMNDDVEALPGWWPPLRAALDAGSSVVFPLTIDGAMRRDFAAWCFAIDRDTIERFGHSPGEFFDPRFRVWFQDTDLLVRTSASGCAPLCVESSRIRHGLSQTVATEDPVLRAWIDRTILADRDAFVAKHPGALVNCGRTPERSPHS